MHRAALSRPERGGARGPQARHSPIDFDFLGYHGLRLAEYRRRKSAVLALVAAAAGGVLTS